MNWEQFLDFIQEAKKVKVKEYRDENGGLVHHINPGKTSKPFSKERDAEIRALMKLNGGGAVKKAIKKGQV